MRPPALTNGCTISTCSHADERHKLLDGFNTTTCPVPDGTIPELFEAQVRRDPDAVALICGTESLSYRDLNAQANRLAHHLISRGRGPRDSGGRLP